MFAQVCGNWVKFHNHICLQMIQLLEYLPALNRDSLDDK